MPETGVTEVHAELADGPASLVVGRQGQGAVAYLNICPHAGRSLNWAPGRFLIEDGLLICAAHGASFRLDDGHCVLGPCRGASLSALPVEVRDGEVYLVGGEAAGVRQGLGPRD
nr:Rieske (2Fe-2S) protein [Lysobacter sp. CAU 1642]